MSALEKWVAENRYRIDQIIAEEIPAYVARDDEERRLIVVNVCRLYDLAVAALGVENV